MAEKNKSKETRVMVTTTGLDGEPRHKPVILNCEPSVNWSAGTPLGNGRLGKMIWGGPYETYMSLNADRLWRNKFKYQLKDKSQVFSRIRQLCLEGKWAEAEALSSELTPDGAGVNSYQPAGQIRISLRHNSGAKQYRRQLDLNDATCAIQYKANEELFEWKFFVSAVEDISVTRITAIGSAQLPIARFDLVRLLDLECKIDAYATEDGIVVLSGCFDEGVRFAVAFTLNIDAGNQVASELFPTVVHSNGYRIEVTGAKSVTLLSTVYVDSECDDPTDKCLETLRSERAKNFNDLLQTHIEDYKSLSERCHIDLGGSVSANVDNAELLRESRETVTPPAVFERIFAMGRYLTISASRPGTLPFNLQGIWNNDLSPAWDCDFHYDLNIQQAYWPTEVTNLSECHLPLAELLNKQIPSYKKNAEKIYGMRGLMMPHASDLTGRFSMGFWGSAPCIAAWMSQHLWWHWEYSQDKVFLCDRAIPFMAEAIKFYLNYVQEDSNGNILIMPTYSPENKADDRNAHYGQNATIDLVFVKELFKNYIEAGESVSVDKKISRHCKNLLDRWPVPGIDSEGKLREMEDATYDHFQRHLSHLVGLYPASQVTSESDPVFVNAYRKAMEHRKFWGFDDWMAFTWAWMGLLHARLGEPEEALACLDILAQAFFMDNFLCSEFDFRRLGWGTVWADTPGDTPWLFQIDGNMGATSLIAEMLLQSHDGTIKILPALPKRWGSGSFQGLVARGGFEVSAIWSNGLPERIEIKSRHGLPATVHVPIAKEEAIQIKLEGKTLKTILQTNGMGICSFKTIRGGTYVLIPVKDVSEGPEATKDYRILR